MFELPLEVDPNFPSTKTWPGMNWDQPRRSTLLCKTFFQVSGFPRKLVWCCNPRVSIVPVPVGWPGLLCTWRQERGASPSCLHWLSHTHLVVPLYSSTGSFIRQKFGLVKLLKNGLWDLWFAEIIVGWLDTNVENHSPEPGALPSEWKMPVWWPKFSDWHSWQAQQHSNTEPMNPQQVLRGAATPTDWSNGRLAWQSVAWRRRMLHTQPDPCWKGKNPVTWSCDKPMGGGMQAKASKIVILCYFLSIFCLIIVKIYRILKIVCWYQHPLMGEECGVTHQAQNVGTTH